MRTLLLSCCLISLAVAGFGQANGARNSAAFSDEEVVIRMDGYQLAGTLSLPRGAQRHVPADRRTPRRARDRRAARG